MQTTVIELQSMCLAVSPNFSEIEQDMILLAWALMALIRLARN